MDHIDCLALSEILNNFIYLYALSALLSGVDDERYTEVPLRWLRVYDGGEFRSTKDVVIVKVDEDVAGKLGRDAIRINDEYYLAYKDVECGLKTIPSIKGAFKGVRLLKLSDICFEACGVGLMGSYGEYKYKVVRTSGGWRVCVFYSGRSDSFWREAVITNNTVEEVASRLNIPTDLAKVISDSMRITIEDNHLPSIVINDKLVTIMPIRGGHALLVISGAGGGIVDLRLINQLTIRVNVDDFIVERDYSGSIIDGSLPSLELAYGVLDSLKGTVTWSSAYNYVSGLIDKYTHLEGVGKVLATLYAIAQAFFDLTPTFPILRIVSESGSIGRRLARVIGAFAPIAYELAGPIDASLCRIINTLHPLIIINVDKAKISSRTALLLKAGYERGSMVLCPGGGAFNLYGPRVIVSRPVRLNLPGDIALGIIEVHAAESLDESYPLEVNGGDRVKALGMVISLKVRYWREFLSAYDKLRMSITGVSQEVKDAYAPLLAVAYLYSREVGDLSLLRGVLSHMFNAIKGHYSGSGVEQAVAKLVVNGILRLIASGRVIVSGGVVEASSRDIAGAMGFRDNRTRLKIGHFMRRAPFKVRTINSMGHGKFIISIEKLYEYVKNKNIDIELSASELEELSKATGLDWSSLNKEALIEGILGKIMDNISRGSRG